MTTNIDWDLTRWSSPPAEPDDRRTLAAARRETARRVREDADIMTETARALYDSAALYDFKAAELEATL